MLLRYINAFHPDKESYDVGPKGGGLVREVREEITKVLIVWLKKIEKEGR